MAAPTRSLVIDGITLRVQVVRKRVKNVNARLRVRLLSVSAPPSLPASELDRIVTDLATRLVRRERARTATDDDAMRRLAETVASRFPRPPRVTDVRFVDTLNRSWGSYSPRTGVVRLHLALRLMPRWVLESVVAHEMAHVFHPDHSRTFWDLLHRVCPRTERARGFLHGVGWLAASWHELPEADRRVLAGRPPEEEG